MNPARLLVPNHASIRVGHMLSDSLVREDDLRARLQADANTMAAAGLDSPERAAR